MPKSRVEKVLLLIWALLILLAPALSASAAEKARTRPPEAVVEEFVTGLVDRAAEPGATAEKKDELLQRALTFAVTYTMITDDRPLLKKTKQRIRALPAAAVTVDEEIIKEFKEALDRRRRLSKDSTMGKVKKRVEQFVYALIGAALDPAASPAERAELLDAATGFAKTYGDKTGDEPFHRSIQYSVSTLPPASISGDKRIIKAFRKAMRHDNRLAMQFLARKVEARREPFVTGIIDRALEPGITVAERDRLLKTAMNFAKTSAAMTGDNAFHRKIHRKTFTARLSEPVRSEPVDGVHVVDAPRASGSIKNVFQPDNIRIRAGETVRWVNRDEVGHVIGTMDFLSDGHFFAPDIGPSGSFEQTFHKPGEYYYICFIHTSMIGKITVEE